MGRRPGAEPVHRQAIARWGNFFNQELYGPPTDLPWGIAIECAHRVEKYVCSADFPFETTGFHPLFFYEASLSFIGGLLALWIGRRFVDRLRPGNLFSFWLIWYGFVRAYLETFREGWNWAVQGIPVATAISFLAIAFGVLTILWRHRPRATEPEPEAVVEPDDVPRDPSRSPRTRPPTRRPPTTKDLRRPPDPRDRRA